MPTLTADRPTQPYAIPRMIPQPDDCTEEDLLDICAATLAGNDDLSGAPFSYIVLVCTLVQNLDIERTAQAERIAELVKRVDVLTGSNANLITSGDQLSACLGTVSDQLAVAQGVASATSRQLLASRDAHQSTILDLEAMTAERDKAALLAQAVNVHRNAALEDVLDLRKLNIALSEENRDLRTMVAFDTTSRTVTGLSVPALNAQLNADPKVLGIGVVATQRVMRCRVAKPSVRTSPLFDLSEVDKIVIDEEDIPAEDRTPTPRERTKPMGEENGWLP